MKPESTAPTAESGRAWSNASVIAFAGARDPLVAASAEAKLLYEDARAAGIAGPPLDVFALAQHLGVNLSPRDDLIDAQIRSTGGGLTVEYNPNRPRGRLRFSIAHELAHSRFADVGQKPRHRTTAGSVQSSQADDWELELICDVIAADLLMPANIVDGLLTIDPDIDFLMEYRRRLDVSTEALLRRVVRGATRPLLLIAFSRPGDANDGRLRVDYIDSSRVDLSGLPSLVHGERLTGITTALACSAVGQTSRGEETLDASRVKMQAVGVPPYPGRRWPRVLALVEPISNGSSAEGIQFVTGDVLDAQKDPGAKIIVHVVPDTTHAWSRFGVGGALGRAFPQAASSYRAWVLDNPDLRVLGATHFAKVQGASPDLTIASIVAQAGFGKSSRARLDYAALETGLEQVARHAVPSSAVVHMPRLGAGEAGGRWDRIEEILSRQFVEAGITAVVHTLPASRGG